MIFKIAKSANLDTTTISLSEYLTASYANPPASTASRLLFSRFPVWSARTTGSLTLQTTRAKSARYTACSARGPPVSAVCLKPTCLPPTPAPSAPPHFPAANIARWIAAYIAGKVSISLSAKLVQPATQGVLPVHLLLLLANL